MKPGSISLAACLFAVPAFAGDVVASLSGRWPFEVAAAQEFRRLAGETVAKKVEPLMETGPRSEVIDGRWIVSEGCRPHACDTASAFVAIDGETGGVWAWTTTTGKTGVKAVVAVTDLEPPRAVVAKLDGWRARLSAGRR